MFRGLEIAQVRLICILLAIFFIGTFAVRLRNEAIQPLGAQAPAITGAAVRHARGELVGPTDTPQVRPQSLPAMPPTPAAAPPSKADQGAAPPPPEVLAATPQPTPTMMPKSAMKHPVYVNRATQEDLETLALVGEKLAVRILEERSARGPYRSADDLTKRVKGIGPRIIEQNKSRLRFD